LSAAEAAARLVRFGPNSFRTQRVSVWGVLRRQINNAVLALLAVTAVVSFFLRDVIERCAAADCQRPGVQREHPDRESASVENSPGGAGSTNAEFGRIAVGRLASER
jgi:hypothetical protein